MCAYTSATVQERKRFFSDLMMYLETDTTVVLMGDFSFMCDTTNRVGSGVYVDSDGKLLGDIVDRYDLFDVAKLKAIPPTR